MIGLTHYLLLSAVLFAIGIFGVLSRRNIIGVMMGIELMFNAVTINFIAMNRYLHGGSLWGNGFAIFVITVAAAEVVVGLALTIVIYRNFRTVYIEKMNLLKG